MMEEHGCLGDSLEGCSFPVGFVRDRHFKKGRSCHDGGAGNKHAGAGWLAAQVILHSSERNIGVLFFVAS